MNLSRAQLDLLCDIAREAGAAIMAFYSGPVPVSHKADESPLTAADLSADAIIRQRLEAAFPGVFILSEESVSTREASPDEPFFLVDPLDGTKEFLHHNDEFTVNIALVSGHLAAGVVHAPALDITYSAAAGLGAFVQRGTAAVQRIHVSPPQLPLRMLDSRSHASEQTARWREGLGRACEVSTLGSSLKFCLIAEGKADLYPRFGPTNQWDTAAAQCVLECAGGQVVDPEGAPLRYARNRPMINPFFVAFGDATLGDVVRGCRSKLQSNA